uniref:Uncharacterized protein n=1 Tax=Anguilla anguilla TaxID=7936 RepID=A0A0E9QP93_ANGAN
MHLDLFYLFLFSFAFLVNAESSAIQQVQQFDISAVKE